MTEQMQDVQENQETPDTSVFDLAHKLFLAGVGAVSLFQDELKKGFEGSGEFAGKLVERGETITSERREQMAAEAEKRQEQAKDLGQNVTGAAEATYNQYSTAALHRMNVPSRSDIQDLSEQIDVLNSKVDEVSEEQKEAVAA
jgi:poly(hydroxyalkanoate) granule-associated protein